MCGTCHMASLFLPLQRTATATICSSSSLLVAAFTQHLASHPPSAPLLKLLCLYQVNSLQLSPRSEGTNASSSSSSCLHSWCINHNLCFVSKSNCNSKWSNATSCTSPMLMHFSRLPCIYRVLSCRSSHQEQSSMSVTKQARHDLLPYKPNNFCTSYQQ